MDNSFPRFYGCLQCFAYITAAGETHAAACSTAVYFHHLKTYPQIEGVGRVAGEKRTANAAIRESWARKAFDLHRCEHKDEQQARVDYIRSRPVRGRYKE